MSIVRNVRPGARLQPSAELDIRVLRNPANIDKYAARRAPLSWRLRNALRWSYLKGWLATKVIAPVANWWGIATITCELAIKILRADGTVEDYGVVSRRVVTDTGVAFVVDDWDNNVKDITNFNYHGVGTGSIAEAASDIALGAESTIALNPDNTRATGTKSQPASNQLRTIGTLTADAQILAREHGLFDQAATGGGTMFDRSVYALITLEASDSIQFTHTTTLNSGG